MLVAALACCACLVAASPANAQPERSHVALLLPSMEGEAWQRLQGQTADLTWTFVRVAGPPARAASRCAAQQAAAALWLERDEGGTLTLWVHDAARGTRQSRTFELAAPGGAQARSAQLEAMALAARASLRSLARRTEEAGASSRTKQAPARPAAQRPPSGLEDDARVTDDVDDGVHVTGNAAEDGSTSKSENEDVDPRVDDTGNPDEGEDDDGNLDVVDDVPDGRGYGFGAELGWEAVHTGPAPWQHGPWLVLGLEAQDFPLRGSLGYAQAFAVGLERDDARLRLGRRSLWAQLAAPLAPTPALRLVPALELGWLQVKRHTVEVGTGLEATGQNRTDLLAVRALLAMEARLLARGPFVLWLTVTAGVEVSPTQLVLRFETPASPDDLALSRAAPVLRLGLRAALRGARR